MIVEYRILVTESLEHNRAIQSGSPEDRNCAELRDGEWANPGSTGKLCVAAIASGFW